MIFLAEKPFQLYSTATHSVKHMTSPDAHLCALEHLFRRELPAETNLASHIMEVTWN